MSEVFLDLFGRKDCRHFRQDRPCRAHKETGVVCATCSSYRPRGVRILIVKFDATGDVLRTTCLLGPLKAKYPESYVVWVTKPAAVPVLQNLEEIDEVLENSADTLARLLVEHFDLLLHPDASPTSGMWAAAARAGIKVGMLPGPDGVVTATNPAARRWLLLGQNDRFKRDNTRTYQSHVLEACELPPVGSDILVRLSSDERRFADDYARANRLASARPVIGLNTGAGARWTHKKWTLAGYQTLITALLRKYSAAMIMLLGEKGEQERNRELARIDPSRIVDAGVHPLRQFFGIVSLCDVIVTGDTLGLHAALGLNRRVVALFGPTSSAEVEIYARGEKLVTPLPCRCCYLPDCDVRPTCMDTITVDDVLAAVERQLAAVEITAAPAALR